MGDRIDDDDLKYHIHTAWELIAPKRLLAKMGEPTYSGS